ncbi:MAG: hypothetical protein ACRCXT_13355 [Paraclostridium sp.]
MSLLKSLINYKNNLSERANILTTYRKAIFDRLNHDLKEVLPKIAPEEYKKNNGSIVLGHGILMLFQYYNQINEVKLLDAFDEVLIQLYGYEEGNDKSFEKSFNKFVRDYCSYAKK